MFPPYKLEPPRKGILFFWSWTYYGQIGVGINGDLIFSKPIMLGYLGGILSLAILLLLTVVPIIDTAFLFG